MKKVAIILSLILGHLGFSQITDTGNKVGIGAGSPSAKLHIYESTMLGTTLGNYQILSRTSGNVGNFIMENKWLVRGGSGNDWYTSRFHNGLSIDLSFLTPGVNTKTWWERDPASGNQFWGNSSVTQMALVGGKLGIGTTNPSANLEVKGGNGVAISLQNDQANYWDIVNSTYGKLDFVRGKSNIYMRIDQFGNVGIGTNTPDSKLSVNGNIHTKEVKVDLIGWSDFVFAKDYDLPTLKEVEQHIQEKGHLKDIPSAEDVKENGIFLGEMDSKLLQKIEELTLYAIEQQKEIDSLKLANVKLQLLSDRLEDIEKLLNYKN